MTSKPTRSIGPSSVKPNDFATASKVMGQARVPKLSGHQTVTARQGDGSSFAGPTGGSSGGGGTAQNRPLPSYSSSPARDPFGGSSQGASLPDRQSLTPHQGSDHPRPVPLSPHVQAQAREARLPDPSRSPQVSQSLALPLPFDVTPLVPAVVLPESQTDVDRRFYRG